MKDGLCAMSMSSSARCYYHGANQIAHFIKAQDLVVKNLVGAAVRPYPMHLIESQTAIKFCNELLLLRKTQR